MIRHVVGLDLSITATGIAGHDGTTSCVGGKADRGDQRIVHIVDELWVQLDAGADLVVIEDLAVHGPGGGMAAA